MIYTNFKLPDAANCDATVTMMGNSSSGFNSVIDLFKQRRHMSALLIANPSTKMLFQLGIMKLFYLIKCPVFLFDLILKSPKTRTERIIAKIKGALVRLMDFIFVIHKDTSGYEQFYNLKKSQFIYVPFKANNFDFKDQISITGGDYVVALGASQRDYRTLIDSAQWVDDKIVIVCSDENAQKHNANVGNDANYPSNVVRIRETIDSETWYKYLAGSKFVVIPILETAIQPAGVSVYLEAMILKKAVVISEGASTKYILENEKHALLVPANDPQKLADAIFRMSQDSNLRDRIAQTGYDYALALGNDAKLRENILNQILSKISTQAGTKNGY